MDVRYKKAFKCRKCPQNNGENGCPMWWEINMVNPQGEVQTTKGCGHTLLPQLLIESIKVNSRVPAAVESLRNVMAGLGSKKSIDKDG